MPKLRQLVVSFGRFWWEFLIGDNPGAFICAVVVIVGALLLRHQHLAAIILLPVFTVAFLLGSTYRARIRTDQ